MSMAGLLAPQLPYQYTVFRSNRYPTHHTSLESQTLRTCKPCTRATGASHPAEPQPRTGRVSRNVSRSEGGHPPPSTPRTSRKAAPLRVWMESSWSSPASWCEGHTCPSHASAARGLANSTPLSPPPWAFVCYGNKRGEASTCVFPRTVSRETGAGPAPSRAMPGLSGTGTGLSERADEPGQ